MRDVKIFFDREMHYERRRMLSKHLQAYSGYRLLYIRDELDKISKKVSYFITDKVEGDFGRSLKGRVLNSEWILSCHEFQAKVDVRPFNVY
jgi:hypothetical protein